MTTHLFLATVKSQMNHRYGQDGREQYVVAEGSSRSAASIKAMRKVYALQRYSTDLHSVNLEWRGTVEVAR